MNLLFVSVFGAAGAVCRFALDGYLRGCRPSVTPWGTIAINVSGSFVLGLVTGLVADQVLPDLVKIAVGIGFCGGFTTYSTASFETLRLLERGERRPALVSGLGTLVGSLVAAGAGLSLAAR